MAELEINVRLALEQAPRLKNFLGAEFNQDWTLDWGSVEAVLKARIDEADETRRRELLREAQLLLRTLHSDDEFVVLLDFLGSGLVPGIDIDESPRTWLKHLHDRMQSGLSGV
ncbi:hypothetical protein SAMN02800687_1293 [Curtobacterium sp. UNCCL20]|uniref:contact-dependent growth inhibition system immunity protein n=1 Tax=Curtobacterium sp. UNCCL20 TaxID=1502773 RepID=UPI00088CA234|nr:contact-dependent growth inhibition system immunity protein [Curtobacterium sp. UNCCL20]SDQ30037.1 hypothetical protein SAMN02800687_1293 [Curtobacterium sp. UNCCL20]